MSTNTANPFQEKLDNIVNEDYSDWAWLFLAPTRAKLYVIGYSDEAWGSTPRNKRFLAEPADVVSLTIDGADVWCHLVIQSSLSQVEEIKGFMEEHNDLSEINVTKEDIVQLMQFVQEKKDSQKTVDLATSSIVDLAISDPIAINDSTNSVNNSNPKTPDCVAVSPKARPHDGNLTYNSLSREITIKDPKDGVIDNPLLNSDIVSALRSFNCAVQMAASQREQYVKVLNENIDLLVKYVGKLDQKPNREDHKDEVILWEVQHGVINILDIPGNDPREYGRNFSLTLFNNETRRACVLTMKSPPEGKVAFPHYVYEALEMAVGILFPGNKKALALAREGANGIARAQTAERCLDRQVRKTKTYKGKIDESTEIKRFDLKTYLEEVGVGSSSQ